jgi:NADH-quinone oxidoreductase subunit H
MSNRLRLIIGGVVGAIVVVTFLIIGSIIANFENIVNWLNDASDPTMVIQCADSYGCSVLHAPIFGLVVVIVILTGFAYTTLLERKLLAYFQSRVGPNRVGPAGLLQPVADAIKAIFKEDIMPDQVDKPVWHLAPMLKAIPIIILVAVIPLGPDMVIPWFDGNWYQIPLSIADVNVGVLWLLAITSLATYGIVLAGWSSNNKYSMLGGLRAAAQMISYELSLGLAIAVPVMIVGSMSIGDIVDAQKNIWDWFVFQNPLAAGLLIITLFAEVSRAPFDLTEAEQELTAGYMTEYSGMKYAMFMMAEYMGMIGVSLIIVSLYFGGYHLIPVDSVPILGPLVLIVKVALFLTFFIWVRATLPRLRYDRLMALGWKVLLPLSLVAVAWTAIATVIGDVSGDPTVYGIVSGIFFLIVVAGGFAILRAEGDSDEEDVDDLANDPLITGDRGGWAWGLLNLVGGIIAIPFAIVNGLIGLLNRASKIGEGPNDETAITPVEGGD